ncbi:MAG: DEAD/DEAH box helicase family protein [Anaerolineales bacterium]|nr:DEAD/DEAH box helicase family protein [Anaerolineales bacterium]
MRITRLREYPFQLSYGPADDRLHDFYIPALSCSLRYDRTAGFFSSTALAVAAAGVARLIAQGGTMRLLVGAQLSESDVRAIERGQALDDVVAERLVAALSEPEEEVMCRRLEVLAWMVAAGRLQIRVVLPKGPDGQPLPTSQAQDYYHPKEGLFTDRYGDQIAFNGSVNESAKAWKHNYERFMVFRSWDTTAPYLAQVRYHFEHLWNGQEPDWIAMDVPEAARQQLLRYRPAMAPTCDPLEREPKPKVAERPGVFVPELQRERVLFQFLRDAPHLLNARWLGAATSAVTPWPHQARIADSIVARFPERFLLCDEVGLGKTIEAGLVLRQLILSGYVRRCLILAPKSVCRQWQEELYEKFAFNIPFFDGHTFRDVFGQEHTPDVPNPWDAEDVFIASSQLAKRRERQPDLLAARPWDLVIVDEAHHARRKDFQVPRYRPNRLLELLMGRDGQPGLKDRTLGLLLMTATPMQIHPLEVWDLLRVLGLGGRWGADDSNFLRFFQELRRPDDDADWEFVFGMVRDFLDTGGELDPAFARQAEAKLGLVDWQRFKMLISPQERGARPRQLLTRHPALVVEMARRHTPLRRYLFRSTRRLLREYVRQGILKARIPHRDPEPVWIAMRADEQDLYYRIEEYISHFYRKYEAERKGLGFVMTVYRRRLTSSFYAVRRSLERRLDFLRGQIAPGTIAGFDEDDLEQEDLTQDISEELEGEERSRFRGEIEYVEDFLAALRSLSGNDSKVERLLADLEGIFKRRETVLIFTQYTDTMDFLREQLRQVYGSQVACYSGRGGEVWNGIAWVPTTKEEIKNAFRQGEAIKILLGTEAASEGLNLQTCGVLINYDMPWNPMRVEQRIGRIDRIGQVHDEVWIRHYFYEDTVEARVYRALEDRIGWFEEVVGELQPILLARMGQAIQTAAMTPAAEREQVLVQELERLREEADARQVESFDLEQYLIADEPLLEFASPVILSELERALTSSLADRFQPHPEFKRAYWLETDDGDVAVTFDAALFDAHPNTLRLLTYGSEVLTALLEAVPEPASDSGRRVLRCSTEGSLSLCAYYALDVSGRPQRVERLADLEVSYAREPDAQWSEETMAAARADFRREIETLLQRQAQVVAGRQRAERLALEEQARQTLLHAALVELAMGQQPQLFAKEALPVAFTEEAVTGLKRHGYPFAPLLRLVNVDGLRPSPTDPFYTAVQGKSREALRGHFQALRDKAGRLVGLLANATNQEETSQDVSDAIGQALLL